MTEKPDLNVQCFIKHDTASPFSGENNPRLLYVSELSADASRYPRVMHAHEDYAEVVLIVSGSSEFFIGSRKWAVTAGDLLIYNAGVVHDEISGPGQELMTYCLAIEGLSMPGLPKNALTAEGAPYIYRTEDSFETLAQLCRILFGQLSLGTRASDTFCQELMRAFLLLVLPIVRASSEKEEPEEPVPEVSELGKRVKRYIDGHYMDSLTLPQIGQAMHVSTWYMAHVFKEMFGYSPMQYLQRRRIGEAQSLLAGTDLSVTEISLRVGYDNSGYFNQQFTRHVGLSPSQYRKRYVVGYEKKKIRRGKEKHAEL